jgi:hypothetical protein
LELLTKFLLFLVIKLKDFDFVLDIQIPIFEKFQVVEAFHFLDVELNILNDLVRKLNFHGFTHALKNGGNISSFNFNHIDIMIYIFIIIVAALIIIGSIIVITWLESIGCIVFDRSI